MGSPYRDREPAADEAPPDFRPYSPVAARLALLVLLALEAMLVARTWLEMGPAAGVSTGVLIAVGWAFGQLEPAMRRWSARRRAREAAAALVAMDAPRVRVASAQARERCETEMPPCEPTAAPSAMAAHQ